MKTDSFQVIQNGRAEKEDARWWGESDFDPMCFSIPSFIFFLRRSNLTLARNSNSYVPFLTLDEVIGGN